MDNYDNFEWRSSHPESHFTLYDAWDAAREKSVLMKECSDTDVQQQDLFLRTHLDAAQKQLYVSPLLDILAYPTEEGETVNFVWDKGEAVDCMVTRGCDTPLPGGKIEYRDKRRATAHSKLAFSNIHQEPVMIKVFTRPSLVDMNEVFREALQRAKCVHRNVCRMKDFCLFRTKRGQYRAYLVFEKPPSDLESELLRRKQADQPFGEGELMRIFIDVVNGLLYLKSSNLAHQGIRLSDIFRGKEDEFKVAQHAEPSEAPLSSDSQSLGATMLRLLETEESGALSDSLRQVVQSTLAGTPLEQVQELLVSYFAAGQACAEAQQLTEEGSALKQSGAAERALEKFSSAEDIYAHCASTAVGRADNLHEWARTLTERDDLEQARKLFAAADLVYSRGFPKDLRRGVNMRRWAIACDPSRREEALERYAAADSLLAQFCEIHTAHNLHNWGALLAKVDARSKAIEVVVRADRIYSAHFPETIAAADNLGRLASLLAAAGEKEKAAEKFAAADALFQRLSPASREAAANLNAWASLYRKMRKLELAEEKFAAADALLSSNFPDLLETAQNLNDWANLCVSTGKKAEAEAKYAAADAIFSRCFPTRGVTNLREWAVLDKSLGNGAKALQKYRMLDKIYTQGPQNEIGTARNLEELAELYSYGGDAVKATEKFAEARRILARHFPSDLRHGLCISHWGSALMRMGETKRATVAFREANDVLERDFSTHLASNLKSAGQCCLTLGKLEPALCKFYSARQRYLQVGYSTQKVHCETAIKTIFDELRKSYRET